MVGRGAERGSWVGGWRGHSGEGGRTSHGGGGGAERGRCVSVCPDGGGWVSGWVCGLGGRVGLWGLLDPKPTSPNPTPSLPNP